MNRNDRKRTIRKTVRPSGALKEFTVERPGELLTFLLKKYPDLARNSVKHLLARHQVAVGGAPVTRHDFPLEKGDVVIVSHRRIMEHRRADLPIIFEDDDFIVIDKPAGLLSVASDDEKGRTAYRMVSDWVRQNDPRARIHVVHRLDEDTSGVLLFVKKARLAALLREKWDTLIQKRAYLAVIEGTMEKKEDTLIDWLKQNSLNLMYVSNDRHNGKRSVTHYKVLKSDGRYSLLAVTIMTGRKNQIRVQLGHRSHHVVGDDKYGEPSDPLGRLGLHASELVLTHPLTGRIYRFQAPVPHVLTDLFKESRPV